MDAWMHGCMDASMRARDPDDGLHVVLFGGVTVDPIEEVEQTVPIVAGGGLRATE